MKRRSTLVNMMDPVGMTLGLAFTPGQTFGSLQTIGGHLWHGQTGDAQKAIESLVHRAVHPQAPWSYLYRGGQWAGALVDGTIGVLEMKQGLETGSGPMLTMGMADFVAGTSSAVVAAGFPTLSLGMSVSAAAVKTGLVWARPEEFTPVQRMKTFFEAGIAVSVSLLRAGIWVVPALCVQAALGATELAYMNHQGFQESTDAGLHWLYSKVAGSAPNSDSQ